MQTLPRSFASVPRDHGWDLLRWIDHVHEDDIAEAAAVRRSMPQRESNVHRMAREGRLPVKFEMPLNAALASRFSTG